MADLPSYVLNIEVSHTAPTNKPFYISNENERTRTMVRLDASGIAVYDMANFPGGYTNGDRIVCFIAGEEYGVADAHTIDTVQGGASITLTGVDESSTTSPAVNIG